MQLTRIFLVLVLSVTGINQFKAIGQTDKPKGKYLNLFFQYGEGFDKTNDITTFKFKNNYTHSKGVKLKGINTVGVEAPVCKIKNGTYWYPVRLGYGWGRDPGNGSIHTILLGTTIEQVLMKLNKKSSLVFLLSGGGRYTDMTYSSALNKQIYFDYTAGLQKRSLDRGLSYGITISGFAGFKFLSLSVITKFPLRISKGK